MRDSTHELYSPYSRHKMSHDLRSPPLWSVTYFVDGPYIVVVLACRYLYAFNPHVIYQSLQFIRSYNI